MSEYSSKNVSADKELIIQYGHHIVVYVLLIARGNHFDLIMTSIGYKTIM